jgi:hypothetical protein
MSHRIGPESPILLLSGITSLSSILPAQVSLESPGRHRLWWMGHHPWNLRPGLDLGNEGRCHSGPLFLRLKADRPVHYLGRPDFRLRVLGN